MTGLVQSGSTSAATVPAMQAAQPLAPGKSPLEALEDKVRDLEGQVEQLKSLNDSQGRQINAHTSSLVDQAAQAGNEARRASRNKKIRWIAYPILAAAVAAGAAAEYTYKLVGIQSYIEAPKRLQEAEEKLRKINECFAVGIMMFGPEIVRTRQDLEAYKASHTDNSTQYDPKIASLEYELNEVKAKAQRAYERVGSLDITVNGAKSEISQHRQAATRMEERVSQIDTQSRKDLTVKTMLEPHARYHAEIENGIGRVIGDHTSLQEALTYVPEDLEGMQRTGYGIVMRKLHGIIDGKDLRYPEQREAVEPLIHKLLEKAQGQFKGREMILTAGAANLIRAYNQDQDYKRRE